MTPGERDDIKREFNALQELKREFDKECETALATGDIKQIRRIKKAFEEKAAALRHRLKPVRIPHGKQPKKLDSIFRPETTS